VHDPRLASSLRRPVAPGRAARAGTIVSDPQSSTALLTLPIVLPAASEPFDILQILLDEAPTLWRDFVVDRAEHSDQGSSADLV
jgi:hypothetical protein